MKDNLGFATSCGLVAYIINVIIHGSMLNALGAFFSAFLLCLLLFIILDWLGL